MAPVSAETRTVRLVARLRSPVPLISCSHPQNQWSQSTSRNIWIIHLDTERDIPDELLDPDSVTAEMFQAPKGQCVMAWP